MRAEARLRRLGILVKDVTTGVRSLAVGQHQRVVFDCFRDLRTPCVIAGATTQGTR